MELFRNLKSGPFLSAPETAQMQDAPNGSNARRTAILLLIKYLPRYYYDPKDPEGRAGHKTQIRCPDWGAKGREIQVLKRQHNIYFRPMMYRGGLPGSCTSQGAMSRRTGHSSLLV
jgi:hypothetical protein